MNGCREEDEAASVKSGRTVVVMNVWVKHSERNVVSWFEKKGKPQMDG